MIREKTTKVFSTSFFVIWLIQLTFIFIFMYLLLIGSDPNFNSPIAWIIGIAGLIYLARYIMKQNPLYIQRAARTKYDEIYTVRNPFLICFLLSIFPKNRYSVETLTGEYSIMIDRSSNVIYFEQTKCPTKINKIQDILFAILLLSLMIILSILVVRVHIENIEIGIILLCISIWSILYKWLKRWCMSKISKKHDDAFITPLLGDTSALGTISYFSKEIYLSSRLLTYPTIVYEYVLHHEKGHIENKDHRKIVIIELISLISIFGYCYLLITGNNYAVVSLFPWLAGITWQYCSVRFLEFGADRYAALHIGKENCIQALQILKKDNQENHLVEHFSIFVLILKNVFRSLRILQGGVTIEERIDCLQKLKI